MLAQVSSQDLLAGGLARQEAAIQHAHTDELVPLKTYRLPSWLSAAVQLLPLSFITSLPSLPPPPRKKAQLDSYNAHAVPKPAHLLKKKVVYRASRGKARKKEQQTAGTAVKKCVPKKAATAVASAATVIPLLSLQAAGQELEALLAQRFIPPTSYRGLKGVSSFLSIAFELTQNDLAKGPKVYSANEVWRLNGCVILS